MTDSLLRSWGGRVLSKMRSMSSDLVLTTMLIFLSFDLELPTECDDEFWVPSGTGRAFEQPKHRPSYTSFFIWNLRLHNIVGCSWVCRNGMGTEDCCRVGHGSRAVATIDP
jgi:hypothetical protein